MIKKWLHTAFNRLVATLAFVLFLIFINSSCQSDAVSDPWKYAAKKQNQSWIPPQREVNKIAEILLQEPLDVPSSDTLVPLGEFLDVGLRNAPTVSKVWQQARETAAAYGQTLAPYYPFLSFDAFLNTTRQGYVFNDNYSRTHTTSYGPQVLLEYTIWDSGERAANSEAGLQALNFANWTHNESMQEVMQTISSAFYDHLYAKALLSALMQDRQDAEQNYIAAQDNLELGIKDITDMLQAKTQFLQKQVDVLSQQAVVENTYINLLKVTGIPTDKKIQIPDFPDCPPVDELDLKPEHLVEIAKNNRPDLMAAKADVLEKEAKIKAQEAELMPKITTNMSGGETWYSDGFRDRGNYTIQFDLTFPIFTGFLHRNQIREAESTLKESLSNLRQLELNVSYEVRSYHNDLDSANQQVILTKEYLEAAQKEYDAVFSRYRQGTIDILDVFSAEASLSDARAKYVKSKRDLFVSMVNLTFATGTLTQRPYQTEEKEPVDIGETIILNEMQ